jgi:DNA-binding NarL/FixJ family response regulator
VQRVVIAEDNALLRDGMVRLFDRISDIEIVGACGSLPDLLAMVDETLPDVVVTDIRMPPTGTDEGIRAARHIRERHPAVGVVVLSQYASPAYALALFEDGSDRRSYLLKDRVADVEDVADAIRAVARGGSHIDPRIVEELVTARSKRDRSPIDQLTTREREILGEIATGKSNAAIAATLYLSERAVEKHSNSIFSKLGITSEPDVNRRVKAVLVYLGATSAAT